MRLQRDDQAASPLVVILTFVAGAVLVTAVAYAVFVDRPEDRLQLVTREGPEGIAFEVTHSAGGLAWDDVTLRFLDRAGTDQAGTFLQAPSGDVDEGDQIAVDPHPPAGTYLLVVLRGGSELSRLAVEV